MPRISLRVRTPPYGSIGASAMNTTSAIASGSTPRL